MIRSAPDKWVRMRTVYRKHDLIGTPSQERCDLFTNSYYQALARAITIETADEGGKLCQRMFVGNENTSDGKRILFDLFLTGWSIDQAECCLVSGFCSE